MMNQLIFHGYDNLPSCEIFNAEVELKIQNYCKSYSCKAIYVC